MFHGFKILGEPYIHTVLPGTSTQTLETFCRETSLGKESLRKLAAETRTEIAVPAHCALTLQIPVRNQTFGSPGFQLHSLQLHANHSHTVRAVLSPAVRLTERAGLFCNKLGQLQLEGSRFFF